MKQEHDKLESSQIILVGFNGEITYAMRQLNLKHLNKNSLGADVFPGEDINFTLQCNLVMLMDTCDSCSNIHLPLKK